MMNWGDFFERFIWAILGLGATLLVVLLAIVVAIVIIELITTGTAVIKISPEADT